MTSKSNGERSQIIPTNKCDNLSVPKTWGSDTSMQGFLNFFHAAYQLNQSTDIVNEGIVAKTCSQIDWDLLINSPIERKHEENSASNPNSGWVSSEQGLIRKKLHQVLQEGLLDSVLPYLVPKHCSTGTGTGKRGVSAPSEVKPKVMPVQSGGQQSGTLPLPERATRRRQLHQALDKNVLVYKSDAEVEIHVCDEVKGLKRTFRCPQRLLVSEMGYFAEVTAGQRLEDMDISVHCDVANFEWLMQWVKRDHNLKEGWPKLDCSNVVAVLTSAAFLQMDVLLEACLQFCYLRANDVLAGPGNVACLNDSILSRLSCMFSNAEVEKLRDRKDRLQGRLYCKLIAALADPEPETSRGHYASLALTFRCSECNCLVPRASLATRIPCITSSLRLSQTGDVRYIHKRAPNWNLTDHVGALKTELRSWRRVYWRLWGEAHWLECTRCNAPFPLCQASWCRMHPEVPQFSGPPAQRSCGRYPCCGLRIMRFSPLTLPTGCQYENHQPELNAEHEKDMWHLFQEHKHLVLMNSPALNASTPSMRVSPNEVESRTESRLGEELASSVTLQLESALPNVGLLQASIWESSTGSKKDRVCDGVQSATGRAPLRVPLATSQQDGVCTETSESSSSESAYTGEEGEEEDDDSQAYQPVRITARPRTALHAFAAGAATTIRSSAGRHWDPSLTTRCNQDDQREYEERAIRRLSAWLAHQTVGTHPKIHLQNAPPGGTFIVLEREWREVHLRLERASNTSGRHRIRSSKNN